MSYDKAQEEFMTDLFIYYSGNHHSVYYHRAHGDDVVKVKRRPFV